MTDADKLVSKLLEESRKFVKGDRLVLNRRGKIWNGVVTEVTKN